MKIDIHADDYALTPNTSKDMLELMREGHLHSISIVPNMSCFDECMDMLYETIPQLPFLPLMSVHINLVEGLKTYEGEMPETLVKISSGVNTPEKPENGNDDGVAEEKQLLNLSWGRLYMMNYLLGRKNPILVGINNEVRAQIDKCQAAIEKCIKIAKEAGVMCEQHGLRIDSHQHTHMIPLVWKACINAIDDGGYKVEYIRNSNEPLEVFLKNIEVNRSFRFINVVKNRILALHSKKVDKFCSDNGLEKMFLWGLIMSGRMDFGRLEKLIVSVQKYSNEKGKNLEILFHPGTTLPEEVTDELDAKAVKDFYLSDGRKIENEAIIRLNSLISSLYRMGFIDYKEDYEQ